MKSQKVIFKQDLCDAKWKKKSLVCQKGTLHFTENNVTDFRLYQAWCEGCDKTKIVDKIEFQKQFENFVKAVDKEIGLVGE